MRLPTGANALTMDRARAGVCIKQITSQGAVIDAQTEYSTQSNEHLFIGLSDAPESVMPEQAGTA